MPTKPRTNSKMPKKAPKKKAWKKANIKDVEDALNDDRLIDQLVRKAKAGKGDDEAPELFTVDTEGSQEHISATTRRAIARAKLFPPKKANIGHSASEELKIARAEGMLNAAKTRPAPKGEVPFDLWTTAPEPVKPKYHCPPPKHAPKTLHQKVSAAPAVLPAHEGQSMNPQTESYEELICTAAARQLETEREDEALERKMRPVTFELRELIGAEALKGMSEEEKAKMWNELKRTAEAEEGEGGEGTSGKEVKLKIKSQAQRNKEKKRKEIDERQKQLTQQRSLSKSVGELGTIQRDMKDEEDLQATKREFKAAHKRKRMELEEKEGVVPKTRRLGRNKFQEEALMVPDTEAAAKGLRAMPLKSCALKDRLSSIVRRGMLPPGPEATRGAVIRGRKAKNRVKNGKKYISPLLRDNLLLR